MATLFDKIRANMEAAQPISQLSNDELIHHIDYSYGNNRHKKEFHVRKHYIPTIDPDWDDMPTLVR